MGNLLHQPSMAAGEIGPHLYGRVDQEMYYIAMRTVRNFIVRQYGGADNRPGTKLTCEARYPDKKAVLIDFTFNEQQTYALEFGDQYMRVIRNGGQVVETAKNITAITNASPAVITVTGHGWSNDDDVYLTGIEGMTELNGRTVRLKSVATNTFEITDFRGNNIDSTAYETYTSGGTAARVFTLTTPFLEADLFELNYAQDNDVLTVVHNNYYPRDITRTDHDAWTLAQFDNQQGPFKDINGTTTTVYASAATGSGIDVVASANIFTSDMVGDLFYIEQSADDDTDRWETGKTVALNDIRRAGFHYYKALNAGDTGTYRPDHIEGTATDGDGAVEWEYLHSGFGIVQIASFTDAQNITADVIKTLPDNVVGSGNTTINWALSAWSDTEGHPAAVAYHKQRFDFAGTTNQPNGVWMSGTGIRTFFGQSKPILDDDAIKMKLNTTGSNSVRHLLPLAEMIALTSASEHLINGRDDVFLATEVPINKVQGYTGASHVRPLIIDNTALFVQDYGNVIRTLQYQLDSDSFGGINLTARSPHLFEDTTIVDWAYARHPFSIVWAIGADGTMNGLTMMQEQRVYGWSRHDTDGTFESVTAIREGDETASYFMVNRTISGETRRYVERMASRRFSELRDAYFLDCGLSYDGRNTGSTTMTLSGGIAYDETEEVTITASTSQFKATDIGNEIAFFENGERYAVVITGYTSGTVATGVPNRTLPAGRGDNAFTDWEFARKEFSPMHHLESKTVKALADGSIVSDLLVDGGVVTLPNPAAVVHIGLGYTCDLETLDIARPLKQTTKYQTAIVPRVFFEVQESRSFDVHINGFENEGIPVRDRKVTEGYKLPSLWTEHVEQQTNSGWSKKGRVGVRQSNPVPTTINMITPEVEYGTP